MQKNQTVSLVLKFFCLLQQISILDRKTLLFELVWNRICHMVLEGNSITLMQQTHFVTISNLFPLSCRYVRTYEVCSISHTFVLSCTQISHMLTYSSLWKNLNVVDLIYLRVFQLVPFTLYPRHYNVRGESCQV